ncbi:nuclear transport factor 2 family protein [Streptomyces triticisoli]|uniref:nuclear transport factor 2 family protein n=1 Tax=Streptomyces triticisoli TaxID=2182797 RepID=UPI001E566940|nr:nuclear transport factor 2 family protein [Streptomyces triticisoli]
MSWTRGPLAVLAVCAVLSAGPAGCGPEGGHGGAAREPAESVGRLLDRTDEEGRRYREVDERSAPGVGVEVRPEAGGNWDVRLTVHRFRFSPPGTEPRAAPGRGVAHLLVDGRPVTRLRTPAYRLSADLVPHGTHHVTARLHADDDTVWATAGEPVQSTADITASPSEPPEPASTPAAPEGRNPGMAGGERGVGCCPAVRSTGRRASPDRRGQA